MTNSEIKVNISSISIEKCFELQDIIFEYQQRENQTKIDASIEAVKIDPNITKKMSEHINNFFGLPKDSACSTSQPISSTKSSKKKFLITKEQDHEHESSDLNSQAVHLSFFVMIRTIQIENTDSYSLQTSGVIESKITRKIDDWMIHCSDNKNHENEKNTSVLPTVLLNGQTCQGSFKKSVIINLKDFTIKNIGTSRCLIDISNARVTIVSQNICNLVCDKLKQIEDRLIDELTIENSKNQGELSTNHLLEMRKWSVRDYVVHNCSSDEHQVVNHAEPEPIISVVKGHDVTTNCTVFNQVAKRAPLSVFVCIESISVFLTLKEAIDTLYPVLTFLPLIPQSEEVATMPIGVEIKHISVTLDEPSSEIVLEGNILSRIVLSANEPTDLSIFTSIPLAFFQKCKIAGKNVIYFLLNYCTTLFLFSFLFFRLLYKLIYFANYQLVGI